MSDEIDNKNENGTEESSGENENEDTEESRPKKKSKKLQLSTKTVAVIVLVLAVLFTSLGAVVTSWLYNAEKVAKIEIPEEFTSQFNQFQIHDKPKAFPPEILFYDKNDKPYKIDQLSGKYRLINFWALWCAPCMEEIPALLNLAQQWPGTDFEVHLVSLDYPENGDDFEKKLRRKRLVALDSLYVRDFEIWEKLGIKGLPVTMIVGPDERILFTMKGPADWNDWPAKTFIENLLEN